MNNPNCDGAGPHEGGEVRRLPWGENQDGASILCRRCFAAEIAFRRERNQELDPRCRYDLPSWESLKVYDTGPAEPPPRCFRIIRFRFTGSKRTIRSNVTEAEAQAHCHRKDTKGDGWFDGYDYMRGCRPKE